MKPGAMLSSERVLALKDILNIKSGGCQLRNSPNPVLLAPIHAENFPARPVRCKQGHSPQSHLLPSHPCCPHPLVQLSKMSRVELEMKQGPNTRQHISRGASISSAPWGFLYKQPLREEFWRQWEPSPGSCRLLNH